MPQPQPPPADQQQQQRFAVCQEVETLVVMAAAGCVGGRDIAAISVVVVV